MKPAPVGTVAVRDVAVGVPVTVAVAVPNFTVSWAAVVENPVPAIVTELLAAPAAGVTEVTVGVTFSVPESVMVELFVVVQVLLEYRVAVSVRVELIAVVVEPASIITSLKTAA